jgi:hypothetical protein
MSASALLYEVRNQVLSKADCTPGQKNATGELWTVKNDSSFPEIDGIRQPLCLTIGLQAAERGMYDPGP